MKKLEKIQVVVWDIDGTLYQDPAELKTGIRACLVSRLVEKLTITPQTAEQLIKENYQKLASTTRMLLELGFNWQELKDLGEDYLALKKQFLTADPRLGEMFRELSGFRHLVATNNFAFHAQKLIVHLGLEPATFEKILGITRTAIKPQPEFFQRVLTYTGLPASAHLFVGDREETEIKPAHEIGMRTAKVRVEAPTAADICLASVYDIIGVLR